MESYPWWHNIPGLPPKTDTAAGRWGVVFSIVVYGTTLIALWGMFTRSPASGILFLLGIALAFWLVSPIRRRLPWLASGKWYKVGPAWLGYGVLAFFLLLLATPDYAHPSSPAQVYVYSTPTPTPTWDPSKPTPTPTPTPPPTFTPTPKPTATPTAEPTATPTLTPTPTPTPLPQVGAILHGKGATAGLDVKVTDASRKKSLVWSAFGNTTTPQGEFIVVYLEMTNNNKSPTALCRCNMFEAPEFTLSDQSGRSFLDYNDNFTISEWRSRNGMYNPKNSILPGNTIKTALVFDAPTGTKDMLLSLKPLLQTVLLFPAETRGTSSQGQAEAVSQPLPPTVLPTSPPTLSEDRKTAILAGLQEANQVISEADASWDTSKLRSVLVGDALAATKRDVEARKAKMASYDCNSDTFSVSSVRLVNASTAIVETREAYTCIVSDKRLGNSRTETTPESRHVYTLVLTGSKWLVSQEQQ